MLGKFCAKPFQRVTNSGTYAALFAGFVDREAQPQNLNQVLLPTRLLTFVESMLAPL